MPGKFGQEDAFLRRGIASANHKDFLAGKEFTVTGGAVGNAPALVFLLTLKTNRSGMGTSGKQDTKTAMFPLISAHSLDIPRKVKADSLCQHKLCTKRFCLLLDGVSQGFAAGFGNTRIVNYLMGDGDLTTELFFFQNQYPVLCPGQIQGGGSITALPIVETQAGDVSAYIPTNVISITDGQIFLETALFNAGNRPAVNVGLSVSRVGGAAQTKAMKKANANLRIELAQYKDMESFSQFSSDLDAETRRQLEHGKALMELLKQPLYQPKSDAEQVVLLTLAAHGVLDEIKTGELRQKTSAFVRQFRTDPSGVMDEIQASGKLSPEQVQTILNAWNAFAGGDAHAIH